MNHFKRIGLTGLIALPLCAWAHPADNAKITWLPGQDSVRMIWDIPSAQVKAATGIDNPSQRLRRFEKLAYESISIRSDSTLCTITHQQTESVRIDTRQYIRLTSDIYCPHDHHWMLSYQLFRELNPNHRAVLRVHGKRYLLGADTQPVAVHQGR